MASANDETSRDPKSWKLQASNDATQWVDLDTQTGQAFATRWEKKSYDLAVATSYKYFRLYITARQGEGSVGDFQLAEWQLFGSGVFDSYNFV